MECVKRGGDRQKIHELLRELSMQAWDRVAKGEDNPLQETLIRNKDLQNFLKPSEIDKLLAVESHVGNVHEKSAKLIKRVTEYLINEK